MKKFFVIAAIACGALFLSGCEDSDKVKGDYEYKTPMFPNDATRRMRVWTDPTTGCNYFLNYGVIAGMTIKFKSDGTPDCPNNKM